jgi:hypothetical protein
MLNDNLFTLKLQIFINSYFCVQFKKNLSDFELNFFFRIGNFSTEALVF